MSEEQSFLSVCHTSTNTAQCQGSLTAAIPLSSLAGLCEDQSVQCIPSSSAHLLSNLSDRSGAGVSGGGGSDAGGKAPVTPQRASQNNPVTPLTPLANLKVLMAAAAASSAIEGRDQAGEGRGEVREGKKESSGEEAVAGRKMKSLALLCKRFLSIVESNVGTGNEFSLDMMAQSLGTNRRRVYDIINVLEAVEMIVKQSKNWYTWNGRGGLLCTLAKLKAMALDDPELLSLFRADESKENMAPPTAVVAKKQDQGLLIPDEGSQDSITEEAPCDDGQTKGGRWDKSLGILCQKFIMLFLISPGHELTLDLAGSILMPDEDGGGPSPFTAVPGSTNPKTKVRRLYDIANVLTTLELIKKKTFLAPNHRKMPGYVWCGPSMAEIDTVSVCRKTDFSTAPVYTRKVKGTALVRKASFGNRPFIHQYEVKDAHNSAPSTPCKQGGAGGSGGRGGGGGGGSGRVVGGGGRGGGRGGGGGGIRRSLSFGGHTSGGAIRRGGSVEGRQPTLPNSAVLARPLCPKQLEYMKEMKEFELEMKKHSHRYPHVVSVFQEFIHKYQSTLEQAAASGRVILPKPPSPSSLLLPAHPTPISSESPANTSTPLSLPTFTNLPQFTKPASGSHLKDPRSVSLTTHQSPNLNTGGVNIQDTISAVVCSALGQSVSRSGPSHFPTLAATLSLSAQPSPAGSAPDSLLDHTPTGPSRTSTDDSVHTIVPASFAPQDSHTSQSGTSHFDDVMNNSKLFLDLPKLATHKGPTTTQPSSDHTPSHPGLALLTNSVTEERGKVKVEKEEGGMAAVLTPDPVDGGTATPADTERCVPTTGTSSQLRLALLGHLSASDVTCPLFSVDKDSGTASRTEKQVTATQPAPLPQLPHHSETASVPNLSGHQGGQVCPPQSTQSPSNSALSLHQKTVHPPQRYPAGGITFGTLQSPEKPAHGGSSSFVHVENSLNALASKSVSSGCATKATKPGIRSGGQASPFLSQLNPPIGVQPLSTLNLLSQLTPQPQGQTSKGLAVVPAAPLHPSSLVNQRPIPATSEVKLTSGGGGGVEGGGGSFKVPTNPATSFPSPSPSPSPSHTVAVHPSLGAIPLGLINPNTFLAAPSTFIPPQALLSSSASNLFSLAQNLILPPFSTLCPPSTPATPFSVTMTHSANTTDSTSEVSPPKRAKLE